MVDFLSSSVQVVEQQPTVRSLPQLPTAVLGMVGLAERGPLDTPTVITSYDDYVRIFGAPRLGEEMALQLRQAFLNGLGQAIVTRVLAGSPVTATVNLQTPSTSPTAGAVTGANTETFDLEPGQTLLVDVDGGGADTVTFDAAAASVTAGNSPTYALTDGMVLTVQIDGGATQTITFNTAEFATIGAATAEEVIAVINAEILGALADLDSGDPRITSDKRGTDSGVQVIGGTANAILGFSTSLVSGTGDVADIDAVTAAEAKTVIEADASGCTVTSVSGAVRITSDTTGASSSIQVGGGSTAVAFGFDNATHSGLSGSAVDTLQVDASSPGAWGNGASNQGLQIEIDPPTNGVVTGADAAFNMLVYKDGVVVEQWPNVNMNASSNSYVETVVNHPTTGSTYIVVTDLLAAVAAPDNRPDEATSSLASGSDGSAVSDATFTGGSDVDKGLNAMEASAINLIAIPDRATTAVQTAMVTYCEVTRNKEVNAIFDPPALSDVAGIRAHKASLPTSEMYGLYWPRVKIANPNTTVYGNSTSITVPVSGSIAGMIARKNAQSLAGPFAQPAGVEAGQLLSVIGLETDDVLRKSNRDLIYPERINPIRIPENGGGVYVDGSRTGKGDGNFPSVGERHGISFLERTLKQGLEFARHQNNTGDLRSSVARTVRGFLLTQMNNGAFATRNEATAFFLDTDIPGTGINNALARAQNKLFVKVGIATAKPAEFVVIIVSQDTRALQEAGA